MGKQQRGRAKLKRLVCFPFKPPLITIPPSPPLLPQEVFNGIISRSEVPHKCFFAAMVIGAVFLAHDCGRFLVEMSGRAFDAVSAMSEAAAAAHPHGAIVVSDAVAQVGHSRLSYPCLYTY